jgi:hypothetical protein
VAGRLEKALLDSIAFSYRHKRAWCRENRAALMTLFGEDRDRRLWKALLIRPLWQLRKALRAHDEAQADLWEKIAQRDLLEFERWLLAAKQRAGGRKGGEARAKNRGGDAWKRRLDTKLAALYRAESWLRGNAEATARRLEASGVLAAIGVTRSTAERYIQQQNLLLKK